MTRTLRPSIRLLAAAVAALGLGLAACGDDEPPAATPAAARGAAAPEAGTYAARVPGSDAYLAVVLDRERVAAYLCDRGRTSAWFPHRRRRDGRTLLRSRTRAATLTLEPAAAGLRARVRLPDGATRALTLAGQSGRAGIYRATARTRRGAVEAGWIVLEDGSQRGAATRFISRDEGDDVVFTDELPKNATTETSTAPPLDTATGTVKLPVAGAGLVHVSEITQPGVIDIDLER
jgi:hypothetical protein